jgi:CheY-like chemotaxis protein
MIIHSGSLNGVTDLTRIVETPHSVERGRPIGMATEMDTVKIDWSESAPLRLLVAEDDTNQWPIMRYFLNRLELQADFATDGQQALEAASADPYDLILMDLRMPRLSGLEAASKLRRLGYDRPIVALTAEPQWLEHKHHLAGFDDLVTKPMTLQQLRETIQRHIPANRPRLACWPTPAENLRAIRNLLQFLIDLPDSSSSFHQAMRDRNEAVLTSFGRQIAGMAESLGLTDLARLGGEFSELVGQRRWDDLNLQLDALKQSARNQLDQLG